MRCVAADTPAWLQAAWPMFAVGLLALLWSGCSAACSYNLFLGDSIEDQHDQNQNKVAATLFFHLALVGATGLMAMALTNWSLRGTPEKLQLNRGTTSMWMKMASQWVCAVLYAWAVLRVIVQAH
jgi:Serine incorporator (Serinc)